MLNDDQLEKLVRTISDLNSNVKFLNDNTEKSSLNLNEEDKAQLNRALNDIKQASERMKENQNIKHEYNHKLNDRVSDRIVEVLSERIDAYLNKNVDLFEIKQATEQAKKDINDVSKNMKKLSTDVKRTHKSSMKYLYFGGLIALFAVVLVSLSLGAKELFQLDLLYSSLADQIATQGTWMSIVFYMLYLLPPALFLGAIYLLIKFLLDRIN